MVTGETWERRNCSFFFLLLQGNHTQCMSGHQHILFPWGERGRGGSFCFHREITGSYTGNQNYYQIIQVLYHQNVWFMRRCVKNKMCDLAHYSTYKRYSDQYFRLDLVWKVEKTPQRNTQWHFTQDPLENVSVFSTEFWFYTPCPSTNSSYICQLACGLHTCIFNS